jgi:hypothetical protein
VAATCPWCDAPRVSGSECPRCGANYAKAEAIKKGGKAAPVAAEPAEAVPAQSLAPRFEMAPEREVEDPKLELKFCLAAIPAMFVLATLFHLFLPFLQRTFLTMPVHELGHSSVAWLCGFWSIPSLWVAVTSDTRGFLMPVLILGAAGFLIWRSWLKERWGLVALGVVIVLLQLWGTLMIKADTARMLIIFGGDGMGMVIATLLMASFFFGKGTQLYKGSLRWGFCAIGAAAFVDIFSLWWATRTDKGRIPFGEQERAGPSDATKLVDDFGWTIDQLVNRHVTVGVVCLVVLAAVYAWGVWRAWQAAQER